MALRDQPYIPWYVDDYATDEKLMECSASATGVYSRLMCLLHKQEYYGKILLKQKDKQTTEQINNFALKIAKYFPYPFEITYAGLRELIQEKVLIIEGDFLIQPRMVSDNMLSETRATSGKRGGKITQKQNKKFALNFAKAKRQANPVNVNVNVNVDKDIIDNKEKEQDFEKLNCPLFCKVINEYPKLLKMKKPLSNEQAERLLSDFEEEEVIQVMEAMENKPTLLKKYESANLTIRSWINLNNKRNGKTSTLQSEKKIGRIPVKTLESFAKRTSSPGSEPYREEDN